MGRIRESIIMDSPLDIRCIRLDAEMEIGRVGTGCIRKNPDTSNPCGLCLEYGFCFREPISKEEKHGSEKEEES